MRLDDFDFELPPELIAQTPVAERGSSRMLHLDGASGAIVDLEFRDIAGLVAPGDVVVFNDTRVIKARLTGQKASGGKVEVLIERVLSGDTALAQVRASHPPRAGSELVLGSAVRATVVEGDSGFYTLRFSGCNDVFALLDRHGAVPLPPYITHAPDVFDETRYQTVYAREPGAVAAPTAGLHFDEALLVALKQRGAVIAHVTLHVGAGTFQPVRVSDVSEHSMHSEWYHVPQATVDEIHSARAGGGACWRWAQRVCARWNPRARAVL